MDNSNAAKGFRTVAGVHVKLALLFPEGNPLGLSSLLLSFKGALHGHHVLLKACGSILLAFPRGSMNLWSNDKQIESEGFW